MDGYNGTTRGEITEGPVVIDGYSVIPVTVSEGKTVSQPDSYLVVTLVSQVTCQERRRGDSPLEPENRWGRRKH